MPKVPRVPRVLTRLRSLDVFRGATVAAMVIVNNPGDWSTVYWPLLHAEWHGWTPTDLIFPFFLFIVGVSITFSQRVAAVTTVLRRGAVIWGLGLFLAGYPLFRLATIRIPGVLARIAWCYVVAALLTRVIGDRPGRYRMVAAITTALLAAYGLLLTVVPFPGGTAGDLSATGNIGAWIDRGVFGVHLWRGGAWDPEGLASTVPAIGTTLLGVLAGWWIRDAPSPRAVVRGLLLWSLAGVVAGLLLSPWLPINKSLWTSSYVLFTAGIAAASLAACYWACDIRHTTRTRQITEPLVALGRNAILLFVLSGLIAKTLIYVKWPAPGVAMGQWIYATGFLPFAPPHVASLLYAVANLLVLYAVLAALHRRRTYFSV